MKIFWYISLPTYILSVILKKMESSPTKSAIKTYFLHYSKKVTFNISKDLWQIGWCYSKSDGKFGLPSSNCIGNAKHVRTFDFCSGFISILPKVVRPILIKIAVKVGRYLLEAMEVSILKKWIMHYVAKDLSFHLSP